MKNDNPFYDKNANPFYNNYVFKKEDLNRTRIKWFEHPFLWLLPTYAQCSDGYAWFYKIWQAQIYFIKYEKLEDTK